MECDMGMVRTTGASTTATATPTITPTPTQTPNPNIVDLSLTKSDGRSSVSVGDQIAYVIAVRNNSAVSANGIILSDTYPIGFSSNQISLEYSQNVTYTISQNSQVLQITLSMSRTGVLTATISGTIQSSVGASLVNTADILLPNGVTDSNPTDNRASDTDSVLPTVTPTPTATPTQPSGHTLTPTATFIPGTPYADIAITKSDNRTSVQSGDAITYVLGVRSTGPNVASGVVVSDLLPAKFQPIGLRATWSNLRVTQTMFIATDYFSSVLAIEPGGYITYEITGTIKSGVTGGLTNTARIIMPGSVTDPNLSNNAATDVDSVGAVAVHPAVYLPVVRR